MGVKICKSCKIEMDTGMFHKHSSQKDGLRSSCKNCVREQKRQWRKDNPEKVKAALAAWRAENNDKVRKTNNIAAKKWYQVNKETHRSRVRDWFDGNPGKRCAYSASRRFRVVNQTIPLTDEQNNQINCIYAECRRISDETGILHHVDHIMPLAGKNFSGLHVPWNLQIITATENMKKGNRV